ncbi:MAG: undecaprenyl/decaprenyl-phosphate alpha-N-acetylglucosaminyl 1-phosphate transferase [Chloroflexi bacterium]|nr:undecaprenyl/decaprenyl-phosphate alpha-N-acetylglucosaminyl 1-phosphate transferase [Chloroflexota bacterium]
MYLPALASIFLVALIGGLLLTPLAGRVGERLDIVDRPRRGELGVRIVARTGGYAIILVFFLGLAVSLPLLPHDDSKEYSKLVGLALGVLAIVAIAVVDDMRRLGPKVQLVGQIVVALIPLLFGVAIDNIASPFGGIVKVPVYLVGPLTVFWMVGMMNTFNFIDTMDGLAAGIGAIASVVLFFISLQLGQYSIAALPLALAGGTIAFLFFNFNPARIFMGTSGSMFIGYGLAILGIIGGAKLATTTMVVGVAIVDVAMVIIYRLSRGRSPFKGGDSAHLPHRLLKLGLSQRAVALLIYGLCLAFGLMALLFTRAEKLIGFAVLGLAMLMLMSAISLRSRPSSGKDSGGRQDRLVAGDSRKENG